MWKKSVKFSFSLSARFYPRRSFQFNSIVAVKRQFCVIQPGRTAARLNYCNSALYHKHVIFYSPGRTKKLQGVALELIKFYSKWRRKKDVESLIYYWKPIGFCQWSLFFEEIVSLDKSCKSLILLCPSELNWFSRVVLALMWHFCRNTSICNFFLININQFFCQIKLQAVMKL